MTYAYGIKKDEHHAFFHWCVKNGLITDVLRSSKLPEFWVRWHGHWHHVSWYGMLTPVLVWLFSRYKSGQTLEEYK